MYTCNDNMKSVVASVLPCAWGYRYFCVHSWTLFATACSYYYAVFIHSCGSLIVSWYMLACYSKASAVAQCCQSNKAVVYLQCKHFWHACAITTVSVYCIPPCRCGVATKPLIVVILCKHGLITDSSPTCRGAISSPKFFYKNYAIMN